VGSPAPLWRVAIDGMSITRTRDGAVVIGRVGPDGKEDAILVDDVEGLRALANAAVAADVVFADVPNLPRRR
jgi:hypothetical protein